MIEFFKRLLGVRAPETRGPSLPLELAKRGWIPYRFPNANVVVFLPEGIAAAHDPEGVLMGSSTGKEAEFSATLHSGFEGNRSGALDFVSHLAKKGGHRVREVGTYRYFFDPTDEDISARAMRFWVIGIPGAVVVMSMLCNGKTPVSAAFQDVVKEVPHLVGELL